MGVVYRASGPDGRLVAVKMVSGAITRPDLIARFAREARVRIAHKNVVEVLDAGTASDGTPYIVFELLEGEDLEARLGRGPLSLLELVDVAIQTCEGLEAAHERGVVHRDLKPANLFRCSDGTIKILDFGVALPLAQHTRLTTEAALLGTPAYLAPEQARGDVGIDSRADLWSLGAVLYEALTGEPPFLRSSALATILAVVREELIPVSARATSVPDALCAVVERALRKSPAERHQTARELRAALAALDPSTLADRSSVLVPMREEPGEQRVVAVLLADRVHDWPLLERAIVDAGGHFERLMGERAVGVFGAERSSGNEALRAARAAMEAELAASFVAVSAGRATLRGTQVSGSVLEVVERVCLAHFPGVVVDTETARLLEGSFQTVRLDDGLLRLVAPSSNDEGMVVDRVPATGALLGRDAEVAQLRQAVRSVTDDGRAVVVWIEAPAGMGKSRLRREAERLLETAPVPFETFRARAEPSHAEVALSVIASLVKGRFAADSPTTMRASLPGRPAVDAVMELVRKALAGADDARVLECAAFLGELAGVEIAENETLRMAWHDPQLVADRIRLAVLDLFEGVASHSATALVVEDLQWADAESLTLLEDLVADLAGSPLLVVVTARPELRETRPGLFSGRDVLRIEPRGLPLGDVAALARGLAGRTLAEPLVRRVADRSGGNPLFVEQIVLALDEDGLLDAAETELPLPLTVEAAVQARLDHLPAAEKDLCKRASVLGRPFAEDELEALGVLDPKTLLASLARRDLVVPAGRARGSTRRDHQFRSRLVEDVAYRMIAEEARAELHKRLAAYLDARTEADPEEVATHWDRGEVPRRAAARYAQAVVAAARRGDGATVLRCSQRALALGAPEDAHFPIHIARAEALRFAGRRAEQGMALAHAIEASRTDAERAEATSKRAAWLARVGRADEALPLAQEAVRIARLDRTPDILASVLGDLPGSPGTPGFIA
jgi:tetratricopeptide (TPR) repeat protein